MSRVIFHLDMDAFYAAIEQRDQPSLRGKPVIVGSPPNQRGVVCAASYEARKFGVRSAMPSVTAGRLCPRGIFVRPRMDDYRKESGHIYQIMAGTGAQIEAVSIDEAYLDLTECVRGDGAMHASEDELLRRSVPRAKALQEKIFAARGLTASIGIASNKLLAKIASDFKKPRGLTLIPERDKVLFLRPLPARSIPGVGKVTEELLLRAGICTIGDLQDWTGDLTALLGSFGPRLLAYARGEDSRPVESSDETKSISSEETFLRDTDDRAILRPSLRAQAVELSHKLQKKQLSAHTVQVKVRYGDFTTLTRQLTLEDPVSDWRQLFRIGCFLLGRHRLICRPVRLLGLSASSLRELRAEQLQLW